MRSLRTSRASFAASTRVRAAGVAFVAAATTAAPLAALGPAAAASSSQARTADVPVIAVRDQMLFFSPNKDKSQDKARQTFYLAEKADVTVKVRRDNKARTLVFKDDLGKVASGAHRWAWSGKDSDGDVVGDGRYVAHFIATQPGRDGLRRIRSTTIWVDTEFTPVKTPTLTDTTVYPQTTLLRDAVAVQVRGKSKRASVGKVELHVRDAKGNLARKTAGYRGVVFDGRDSAGVPLPAGQYSLRFRVTDKAGNTGQSDRVRLHVSAKPLVEKTVSLVLPPTGSWNASEVLAGTTPSRTRNSDGTPTSSSGSVDGRSSLTVGQNETRPSPCGVTVPSEVYPNAGAMSYRSNDTCTNYRSVPMSWVTASLRLDTLTMAEAPRGLYSSRVSMRGRPTVSGETDSGELFLGGPGLDNEGRPIARGVTSPAVTGETVTSTETVMVPPPLYGYYEKSTFDSWVVWTIATRGVDSFDVADVTVDYTYLVPQQ